MFRFQENLINFDKKSAQSSFLQNLHLMISLHVFTNSENTNLRICFTFLPGRNVQLKQKYSKDDNVTIHISKETLCSR